MTFFLAGAGDAAELDGIDPDTRPSAFRRGELVWVLLTWLRLRRAGYPVALSATPPARGLLVFHAKQKREVARAVRGRPDLVLVGIRGDMRAPAVADFEILQNGRFADNWRRFAVPHWPQPGLLPRDPGRGTGVRRVGYLGLAGHLHPDFLGEGWRAALAAIGVAWECKAVRDVGDVDPREIGWEDYRTLDAVVAVRPPNWRLRHAKPASKLINAWHAGVPALLGPEFPYREIRRSDDDYIEVRNAGEALAALRRLGSDADLFARMVANGHRRAREFTAEAITLRWAGVLFEEIPARVAGGGLSWSRRLPLPLRVAARRCGQVVGGGGSR